MITTTLENLTQKVQENRLNNLAINIVKYQNFKSSEIIRIIDNAGYSKSTLLSYINNGIGYLTNNKKNKKCGRLYEFIDEAVAKHTQPLMPKDYQKRGITRGIRTFNNNKVQTKTDIAPFETIRKIEITKELIYAVQMDKNLRIQNSLKEAESFLEGLSFMGNTNAKIVKLDIEEL